MDLLGLKRIIAFEAANKRLKVLCNECDFVVPLLIDVDYLRLTTWAAFSVIETDHVVASRRTIRKVDANWGIAPLTNPEAAIELTTQRIGFVFSDRVDACDSDVIFGPRRPLTGSMIRSLRDAAVLNVHQGDVRLG